MHQQQGSRDRHNKRYKAKIKAQYMSAGPSTTRIVDNATEPEIPDHRPNQIERGKSTQPPPATGSEKAIVFLTTILAFAAIAQAIVTSCQWTSMKAQVADQIRATDELAKQTAPIIEATKASAGQLKQAKTATEQTQTIIDRTAMEQRAWLAVSRPIVRNATQQIREITPEQQFWAVVPMRNSGRTPAYVIGHASVMTRQAADKIVEGISIAISAGVEKQAITNPIGADTAINYACPPGAFLKDEIEEFSKSDPMKDGQPRLFVIGAAVYRDVYKEAHRLRYCLVWDGETKQFILYPKYQYMD